MKQNEILFPNLLWIRICNYSLYKKDIDFHFVDGVNLIIGGNGMGKTTFINILRYAIIGAYRSHTVFERIYQTRRIIRRKPLHNHYFRNRMAQSDHSVDAFVEVCFKIGNNEFTVKRSLYEHKVMEFRLTSENETHYYDGETVYQDEYDRLLSSYAETNQAKKHDVDVDNAEDTDVDLDNNSNSKLFSSLQYKYERQVSIASGLLDFDAMIFFIINMFIFDELRTTIFWDEKKSSAEMTIQEYLTAILLSDLAKKLEELSFEIKYLDSKIRHGSEEKKPLKNLLSEIAKDPSDPKFDKDKLEKKKTSLLEQIDTYDSKRRLLENQVSELRLKHEQLLIDLSNINSKLESYTRERNNAIFRKLHDQYSQYLNFLLEEHICPFCKNDVEKSLDSNVAKGTNCFYCNQIILRDSTINIEGSNIAYKNRDSIISSLTSTNLAIEKLEKSISEFDTRIREHKSTLIKVNRELRDIEHAEIKNGVIGESNDYNYIENKMLEIDKKIEEFKTDKKELEREFDIINANVNEKRIGITRDLSSKFSKYAEMFLPYMCRLVFAMNPYNINYECFIPEINGIRRYARDELSESQAFFMEQSFRLSFLELFYTKPSFFIFETPDSSLDVSFCKRAADTLLLYLERPNSLIVTFNYNNSELLKHLYEELPSNRIALLDMIEFGNISDVHKNSDELYSSRAKLMEALYEKE